MTIKLVTLTNSTDTEIHKAGCADIERKLHGLTFRDFEVQDFAVTSLDELAQWHQDDWDENCDPG